MYRAQMSIEKKKIENEKLKDRMRKLRESKPGIEKKKH